jgi:hypothetical protein
MVDLVDYPRYRALSSLGLWTGPEAERWMRTGVSLAGGPLSIAATMQTCLHQRPSCCS